MAVTRATCHVNYKQGLTLFLLPCVTGTFIAGMLARHHRKRVHTLCLMDPVCFGM